MCCYSDFLYRFIFCSKISFQEKLERRDISYFTAFLRFDDIEDIYKKVVQFDSGENTWSDMFSAVKTVMDWL